MLEFATRLNPSLTKGGHFTGTAFGRSCFREPDVINIQTSTWQMHERCVYAPKAQVDQ